MKKLKLIIKFAQPKLNTKMCEGYLKNKKATLINKKRIILKISQIA